MAESTSLAELERDFEPCGGFLRRRGCTPKKPSVILTAADVLRMALKFRRDESFLSMRSES